MEDYSNTFGRDAFYVNKKLITTTRISDLSSDIADRLRYVLQRYYTVNDQNRIIYQHNINQSSTVQSEVAPDSNFIKFTFLVPPADPDEAQRLINALGGIIDSSKIYSDFHFKASVPIEYPKLETITITGRALYIDTRSKYNFYVPRYEKFLNVNPSVSENVLPNFYTLYAEAFGEEGFKELNSLDGNFTTQHQGDEAVYQIQERFLTTFDRDAEVVKSAYGDYFSEFAQDANNLLNRGSSTNEEGQVVLNRLSADYNTYLFRNNAISLLTSEASKAESFPFYNEIKFSTDTKSEFGDILRYLGQERAIVMETLSVPPTLFEFGSTVGDYYPSEMMNEPAVQKYNLTSLKLPYWDLGAWMSTNFSTSTAPFPGKEIGTMDGLGGEMISDAESFWRDQMSLLGLGGAVNTLIKEKERSLREMWNGRPSYSETVFYKIDKVNEAGELLSTYYIPNSSTLDECRFMDTQVKYGKKYTYIITSYILVIGSQYTYDAINPQPLDGSINIEVRKGSAPRLFGVVSAVVQDLTPTDSPPMSPEVSIVPYKNIGNRILINMNASTGDRDMRPIAIQAADVERFNFVRMAQRRLDIDPTIRFKSDDIADTFEIFRTTTAPQSYQDFSGQMIHIISTEGKATGGAYEDTIDPNTKYYYTMRCTDIHGNISNPSPIYEIEMKTDASAPYLVLNILNLDDQKSQKKKPFKSMQRYVQIIPSTTQGLLNTAESIGAGGTPLLDAPTALGAESVVLGVANEKLWGKKFRIRFTSKKTGRKIEVDVNFTAEHQL